jgi:protein involved in polysaccharide export with SLBB domain
VLTAHVVPPLRDAANRIVTIALILALPCTGIAQEAGHLLLNPSGAQYETRAQLQAKAEAAAANHRNGEAFLLRSRLQRGDFQEGDRIVVLLQSTSRLDTLQVRSAKMVQLPGMSEQSLDGVLRSELDSVMRSYLGRYLKNPDVHAVPLLPVAVIGNVVAPGYYYMSPDNLLRDVLMRAGGVRDGDWNKIVIRRANDVIWRAGDVRIALADGLSIDRLHLRAGDEVIVPDRRRFPVNTTLAVIGTSLAVTMAIIQIRQMNRRPR